MKNAVVRCDSCGKEHIYPDNREKTAPAYLPLPAGWVLLKEPDLVEKSQGFFTRDFILEGEWRHFDSWACAITFAKQQSEKEDNHAQA